MSIDDMLKFSHRLVHLNVDKAFEIIKFTDYFLLCLKKCILNLSDK